MSYKYHLQLKIHTLATPQKLRGCDKRQKGLNSVQPRKVRWSAPQNPGALYKIPTSASHVVIPESPKWAAGENGHGKMTGLGRFFPYKNLLKIRN